MLFSFTYLYASAIIAIETEPNESNTLYLRSCIDGNNDINIDICNEPSLRFLNYD